MSIIYWLIPLSIILCAAGVVAFFWAVRSGQFDDMHTPALKILDDDHDALEPILKTATKVTGNSDQKETM